MSINARLVDPEDRERQRHMCYPSDLQMSGSHQEAFCQYLDPEDGIGWLEGKTGAECLDKLWTMFTTLAPLTAADQWEYSSGFYAMLLWSHAKAHPDAIFSVSY